MAAICRGVSVSQMGAMHTRWGGVRHWRGGKSVVVARRGVVQGSDQFSNRCWPVGPVKAWAKKPGAGGEPNEPVKP